MRAAIPVSNPPKIFQFQTTDKIKQIEIQYNALRDIALTQGLSLQRNR